MAKAQSQALPDSESSPVVERQPTRSGEAQRERHAAVIALLDQWVAGDMGDDEEAWRRLKKRIDASRTSSRKRFSD